MVVARLKTVLGDFTTLPGVETLADYVLDTGGVGASYIWAYPYNHDHAGNYKILYDHTWVLWSNVAANKVYPQNYEHVLNKKIVLNDKKIEYVESQDGDAISEYTKNAFVILIWSDATGIGADYPTVDVYTRAFFKDDN